MDKEKTSGNTRVIVKLASGGAWESAEGDNYMFIDDGHLHVCGPCGEDIFVAAPGKWELACQAVVGNGS